eukprot:546354_1
MKPPPSQSSIVEELGAKLELESTFKDTKCQQDDILNCKAVQRMKIILNKYDAISQSNITNECKDELVKFMHSLFDNNYTNTLLLNDFNHIKYYHHLDEDTND